MVATLFAAVLLALAPVRADDARAQIDALLTSIEAAVLAGDAAAYIAHVDPADPVFLKEQQNWAADFKRHVPVEFDIALVADPEARGTSLFAPIRFSWRLDQWKNPRTLDFTARFAPSPKDSDSPHPWLYSGESWETLDGEGVLVFFPEGRLALARQVAQSFPEVRAHVEDGFQLKVDRVQEVKLYPSMRHLQHSIYLSYTDGLGGWNEPGESVKLLATGLNERAIKPLLAHEFGHVATFEMGDHATHMPWWILEGVAELASESFSRGRRGVDRAVRAWARTGALADWDKLADFHDCPPELQGYVYSQGHHMVGYISDTHGREARNAWLRAMAQGQSLDQASREALGLSFDELDAAWRASVAPAQEPAGEPEGP